MKIIQIPMIINEHLMGIIENPLKIIEHTGTFSSNGRAEEERRKSGGRAEEERRKSGGRAEEERLYFFGSPPKSEKNECNNKYQVHISDQNHRA